MKALPTATTIGASMGLDSMVEVSAVKAFGTVVKRAAT